MRIVAGKYRRRKLLANPGHVTRPITDRVKETLFERLKNRISGRRVLDVFAGTGTLGLEALSRGAETVVFIENDRRAFELLEGNVAALGVAEQSLCWRTDAFRCSFRPKGLPHLLPYDVIFFDPPYRMIADLKPGSPLFRSLDRLARDDVTASDALLILRTPPRAEFRLPAAWTPEQTIQVSSMQINLLRKQIFDNGGKS